MSPTPPRVSSPRLESELSSSETTAVHTHINHVHSAHAQPEKKPHCLSISEHLLGLSDVCAMYDTKANQAAPAASPGLSAAAAASRLETDGPNIMSPPKSKSPLLLFLECLFALFNFLLIIAAVMTFILYGEDPQANSINIYIGPILLGVTILNATIEFIQLMKSARVLRSFMNLVPSRCNVIRDGSMRQVSATELVKGDIVFIRMGDKTPADIYLFSCSDLKVDNSSLTGESEPQDRIPSNTHANPLEATNLAFNGSLVVCGEGFGIVIRTGDDTVIGQIAGMTQGEKKRKSPMTEEIETFVKIIGAVSVLTALIFFAISVIQRPNQIGFALNFGIGVLLAWVPQGLPATVTVLLTIAAKRMSAQKVLVKDLYGVETLGAITLLATDKTGTLTRNQMTVAFYWTHQTFYSTSRMSDDRAADELPFDTCVAGVSDILHISALCSRARFDNMEKPILEREIFGDATESGLFRLAAQQLKNFDALSEAFPKVFEIPFNSETKWHMSIHRRKHANGDLVVYIKGAPERVLRICNRILGPPPEATTIALEESHEAEFRKSYERLAGKGHRVLAFAKFELPGNEYPANFEFNKETKNYPQSDFTFVGLASLEDPPKHGVREAVGHCRRAGIKVVMVTGDHPLTAQAIARKINLMILDTKEDMAKSAGVPESSINEDEVNAIVIHGEKIDSLTDHEWDTIFEKQEIIFARTSPKHKLSIVKKAQSLGHIVGVTGDGVNDSPALKKADLGIAMNLSGSDVSKEAASMILLDDNFASIINGIREGRLIFANLKKAIKYVVTHIIPEVIPQLLYVVASFPLSLGALQILVIDLGFELFCALSYAYELPENENLMKLLPRKPVTADSVMKLRKKAEFDSKFLDSKRQQTVDEKAASEDENEGGVIALNFKQKLRRAFCFEYWRNFAFNRAEDAQVLVDFNTLSYAYLEVGILEFIAAQLAFFIVMRFEGRMTFSSSLKCEAASGFTEEMGSKCLDIDGKPMLLKDLKLAQAKGQSIYYLSLMITQMFNLFACKCLMSYPFRSYIFKNKMTLFSVIAGAAFALLIVYLPFLNEAFNTSYELPVYYLAIPLGFGILIFFYSAFRFFVLSKLSPIEFAHEPPGLQLQPTRWSMN